MINPFPLRSQKTGALGWVGISLSEPMDPSSIETALIFFQSVLFESFWQSHSFWVMFLTFLGDSDHEANLNSEV
jgi:hypothetical protein